MESKFYCPYCGQRLLLIGKGRSEETLTSMRYGFYCICPPCHLLFFIFETESTVRFERKGTLNRNFIALLLSQELESHLEDNYEFSS